MRRLSASTVGMSFMKSKRPFPISPATTASTSRLPRLTRSISIHADGHRPLQWKAKCHARCFAATLHRRSVRATSRDVLPLAEALAETGWRAEFAVAPGTFSMVPALPIGDFAVHELGGDRDEPAALRDYCPDGVDLFVVDHYQRDIQFEEACRGWARQILVMDDATGRRHDCDILVDAAASDRSVYEGVRSRAGATHCSGRPMLWFGAALLSIVLAPWRGVMDVP